MQQRNTFQKAMTMDAVMRLANHPTADEVYDFIKEKYPRARVCCVNLPRRSMRSPDPAVEYNNAIARAVKGAGEGYFVADFYGSEMSGDNFFANTHDDLHPNENGMRLIADFIIKSFKENVKSKPLVN